ncbi:GLPGLI family protein [Mucilaginibacter conchicola]|uniref:GLPGLI family protein n=1 Tax=Mucilaginibacter conchicola TaxID=2303333 RepID=A0A372NMY1_9SPHI|nr:GLPGLI family protein [Mucilaginibacter conchicola]RFZ90208.1 GLPGLI family protein [Mucilaginibacter conchicola]
MKNIALTIIATLFCSSLFAQAAAHFTTSGTVEYEKRVNMYAIIKKRLSNDEGGFATQAFENYKKTQPQFKSLKSTLTFTGNKTLFTPIEPTEAGNSWFSDMPEGKQQNTIYTDLNTNVATSNKAVFEEKFLMKDTARKINWKITDETREIAGYTCRRANAVIMDSIYVVAFYSDEIPVSGGPESFTGLPGMILGVALPHDNMTWFATKVTDMTIPENQMKIPAKGKATDYKGLEATLKKVMKDWGNWGQSYLKIFLL